jgi:multisubunit Na+/H+ antiporter MnhC subunit
LISINRSSVLAVEPFPQARRRCRPTAAAASLIRSRNGRAVDPDQFARRAFSENPPQQWRKAMPMETAVMLFAIVIPFAVFAGVLGWAQSRTK